MIILSNNQWKCDGNLPKWEAKGEDCSVVRHFRRLTEPWFDPISDHYPLYVDLAPTGPEV